MTRIRRIVDPCIVKTSDEWRFGRLYGKQIRIAGLLPPTSTKEKAEAIRTMESKLLGTEIRIRTIFYAETGPTLVAEIEVPGISLTELFADRLCPNPPRTRTMDIADIRDIRRVRGHLPSKWINPLRRLPLEMQPSLLNTPFPTDPWLPGYGTQLERVKRIYSAERSAEQDDVKAVEDFLRLRNERVLILFADCGWGKSWFLRNYLAQHPPPGMDVGYIDAIDFPHGRAFQTRLHMRLSEILGEYVNSRLGGLFAALGNTLLRDSQGLFPGKPLADPQVHEWAEHFLQELALPSNIIAYNTLRLESYHYADRQLLLVIDNIDGFDESEQGLLFDQVIEHIAARDNVFLIVPLRPSTTFFVQRLSSTMQRLFHGHYLSRLQLSQVLKRRLLLSETGKDIATTAPDGRHTMTDLVNAVVGGDTMHLLEDLAQGDVRHFIRLFRRILYSDDIGSFENLGKEYYDIQALMLKRNESFTEENSFLLNAFDNDRPDMPGNALVRWRVLEYFLSGHTECEGPGFDYYFLQLGYDLTSVLNVVRLWHQAGALELLRTGKFSEAHVTPCGRRYRALLSNLWYCICVKTGMYIDSNYILRGDEARKEAAKLGVHFFGEPEWISDDNFIAFLADEETLEELRRSAFTGKGPQVDVGFHESGPRSISRDLWYDYVYQQNLWERKREKRTV